MRQNIFSFREKIILVVVLLAALIFIFLGIDRVGKTKIEIIVIPENATVYINDDTTSGGTRYLKPGDYTIKATSPGFADETQKITVKDDSQTITLLPEPVSDEAISWLNKHPDIQERREVLAGQQANKEGAALYKNHPILNRLPIIYNHGDSSIGSKSSERVPGSIAIVVQDTTTSGRASIIQWMHDEGYTPGDMEVLFPDFMNPLVTNDEQEQS